MLTVQFVGMWLPIGPWQPRVSLNASTIIFLRDQQGEARHDVTIRTRSRERRKGSMRHHSWDGQAYFLLPTSRDFRSEPLVPSRRLSHWRPVLLVRMPRNTSMVGHP